MPSPLPEPTRRGGMDRPAAACREAILDSHRDLNELLRRVERGAGPLPPLIAELEDVLRRHFGQEEAPDGLCDVLARRGVQRDAIRRLTEEHTDLLGRMRQLREREDAGEGALRAGLTPLLEALRGHERRELRLLMGALTTGLEGDVT